MTRSIRPDSERIADDIQHELQSSAVAPGTIIASEGDLRAAHNVGRAALRQAVRILENRGIVKMRRGQGGGLVVQQRGPEAAARSLAIVIESELQNSRDVNDLLKISDNQIFTRDVAKRTLQDFAELRALTIRLDTMSGEEFALAAGNRLLLDGFRRIITDRALALAQWTCLECGIDLTPPRPPVNGEPVRSEFWTLSVQCLEAMIAHDVPRLFDIRRRQYLIMEESMRDWPIDQPGANVRPVSRGVSPSSPRSHADMLTREILRDARAMGWQEGARLGSASELEQRYGASSLVLRQAVRVLEETSAVRMERGRTGGLFVAKPSREIAIGRAKEHLKAGLPGKDARAFLLELLLACLSLARSRATPVAMERCRLAISRMQGRAPARSPETRELFDAIAELANNPALTIFIEILEEFALNRAGPVAAAFEAPAGSLLEEMYQALIARDSALSRRAFIQFFEDPSPEPGREKSSD